MSRQLFCKVLLVVVAVFGLLALSGVLLAQGRSADAFERVRQVQQAHTDRLMAMNGVEGTAIGLDETGRPAMLVLLENGNVGGVPKKLDGVPVKRLVTGKIYALPKPPSPPGQDKKNPPPAPPTGLTAIAASETAIDLDWSDNTEEDFASYSVYRSTTSGEGYVQIASGLTASQHSDTGLAAGTTYYYVVTAVDTAEKESDNSSEASATTEGGTGDLTPPAAPTGVTATAASSTQIDLDWDDNDEPDLAYYNVSRSTTSGGSYSLIDSAGASDYSDTGLAPETTYYYVVTAVDTSDNESIESSPEASATTDAGPVELPIGPRPAPIGVSTGHPNITAGTIGCRVTKNGNVYALSNNHVYADENRASIGDNVLQPGSYDGGLDPRDAIGTLADFEPIEFHPRARNTIDAAIAAVIKDDGIPRVGTATPEGGYGTPSAETRALTVEDVDVLGVQKYGRTTGLTTGEVTGINATVKVRYDSGVARFIGQIIIGSGGFSDGGDSGSLIVCYNGEDDRKAVGLLFAGSSTMTVANPIDDVLDAFGVTIDDGE